MNIKRQINFSRVLRGVPSAVALIEGSYRYPEIDGILKFYQTPYGVVVSTEVTGLNFDGRYSDSNIFAIHIHEGSSCTGNAVDPFVDAKTHYNPMNVPHPYHAGDLPPLFSSDGMAYSVVLTNRFTVDEIIGKTIVIHDSYDDFTTQPAGNSGNKIACGEITYVRRK